MQRRQPGTFCNRGDPTGKRFNRRMLNCCALTGPFSRVTLNYLPAPFSCRIPPMKKTLRLLLLSATLAVFAPSANFAADHFLVLGGGYNPSGNQISLEKNVLFFERLLSENYSDNVACDLLFADGSAGERDLQFVDPANPPSEAHQLMARIFKHTKHQTYQYRNHELPRKHQAATKANVEKWFHQQGAELGAGDRLLIYVTAHGGRSRDKKNASDTRLYLWNQQYIRMREFAGLLDELDPQVPVAVVMVQCYSGGFANLVFKQGDPKQGVAEGMRCGFFATVENRVAAGCTPDINEENYREYSSYFFAAISGTSRTGSPIEQPDFNGDGFISFEEAHAHTVLTSTTIDIPIKTSGAFLRSISRYEPKKGDSKTKQPSREEPPTVDAEPTNSTANGWLKIDSPYAELLTVATPVDHAMLEGLSHELGLAESKRAAAARKLIGQINNDKKKLAETQKKRVAELGKAADSLKRHALKQWPEIENRFHPRVDALLSSEAETFLTTMKKPADFKKLQSLHEELKQLADKKFDLDRREAKCQRLIRILENVALEANLPNAATAKQIQQYQKLRAAEAGFFGAKRPATTVRKSPSQTPPANATSAIGYDVYGTPVCD